MVGYGFVREVGWFVVPVVHVRWVVAWGVPL